MTTTLFGTRWGIHLDLFITGIIQQLAPGTDNRVDCRRPLSNSSIARLIPPTCPRVLLSHSIPGLIRFDPDNQHRPIHQPRRLHMLQSDSLSFEFTGVFTSGDIGHRDWQTPIRNISCRMRPVAVRHELAISSREAYRSAPTEAG